MERLEDRRPLATIAWDGEAGDNKWSTPLNWGGNQLPGIDDIVEIRNDGTYTVDLDLNTTVSGIELGGQLGTQTLNVSNHTLTLAAGSHISANGRLEMQSATIDGTGTLSNQGDIQLTFTNTVSLPIVNQSGGTFRPHGGVTVTTPTNAFTNEAGGLVTIYGSSFYGNSTLTFDHGFTNDGEIRLRATNSGNNQWVNLAVTSGTLVNNGTIRTVNETGVAHNLLAEVDNRGTIWLDARPLTISKADAQHINSDTGVIDIDGGDLTVTQSGTSPSFGNSGTIDVADNRKVTVNNGSFTLNTGLNIAPNTEYSFSGITIVGTGAIINQGTLGVSGTVETSGQIQNQGLMKITSTTINSDLVNQSGGLIQARGTNTINGAFSNEAGSTLMPIGAGNGGHGIVTVTNGFTNAGTINLYATNYGNVLTSRLNVTNGELLNTGFIFGTGDNFPTFNFLGAQLNNQGTVRTVTRGLRLDRSGASHVNTGSIEVTGHDFEISGATSFSTSGDVTVGSDLGFDLNTDFVVTSGSVDVAGRLDPVGALQLQGGVLRGAGVVKSAVANSGVVQPGSSPGKLRIEGNYSQSDTGSLQIDLAGPDAYDRLEVTGTATLDGSLDFTLANDYSPDSSTSFDVLTYGSHGDEFGAVQGTGLGNVALTGTTYAANAFSLTLEPVPEGSATPISQQLHDGWNDIRAKLDDWATLFDLSATDQLAVLPKQLAQLLNLQNELANLTLPEIAVSNTYEILADALTNAGLSIECMTGDVGDIPACVDGAVEARFETTLSGLIPAVTAQYNDQTPGVLAGLFSSVDLNGDVTLTTADLEIELVFGVDEAGFYLADNSKLDLHVVGNTDVDNNHDIDPVAQLTGTGEADVRVVVAPVESRVRDVTATPADIFATTAFGSADVSLTVTRDPLELAWDANFTVSADGASNITTAIQDVSLQGTLTLPGLTEQGPDGPTPSDLQITGTFEGNSNAWTIAVSAPALPQHSFYGFAIEQFVFTGGIAPGQFLGTIAFDFVEAGSELAGLFPLNVEHLEVGFDGTASDLNDFSLAGTVGMGPGLLLNDNIPFDPSLVIETAGLNSCELAIAESKCTLAISSAAISEPNPQLVVDQLESVTLGIANLNVGEIGFGGSVTLSDFSNSAPSVVSGSLTIESGIEVLDGTQGSLQLNGATIAITGEFNPIGAEPNLLKLEVDGEVNFHAMIKNVMELQDFGFTFDMSLQNAPGQFDPSFTFLLNSLRVGEVIIELGDFMVLTTTDATFNFNDTPIATFGSIDVSFGEGVLAAMSGKIENLEVGADLLPKLSEIQGVELGLPAILADSLQWLPVSIDKLGLDFNPDLLSTSDDGINIDDETAFSVIASGNVTAVKYEGDTKFPLDVNAKVTGLTIDVEKLHDGEFPITNVDSISIGLEPVELVDGFTIAGALGFGTVPLGASPDCGLIGTGDVLFGRILGEFELDGYGGGVELILSELGPVAGFIKVPLAIALGQTGFLITGAKGTLQFGQPPLPRITDARQLNGDEFQNPIDRDFGDPAVLQQFLESAASNCAPTWSQAFTLAVSGTLTHVAVAGLLSGEVTLATMVGLGGDDAGLNMMGFGDLNILGVTLAEARLLFDLRDPLEPKIAAAVEAPPGDNILSLFIPAKAEAGALLTTDGIALAVGSGVKAFVDNLYELVVDQSAAAFDRGSGLFEAVLDAMANRMSEHPNSALANALWEHPNPIDFTPEGIVQAVHGIFAGIAGVGEDGFSPSAFLDGKPFQVTSEFVQEFLAAIPVALDVVREQTDGSIEEMREQLDLAAVDSTGEFPQILLDLLSPIALLVPRREDGTPSVSDGETFTISIGARTEMFEFDDDGDVAEGRIAIPFGPANNVAAVAASIASVVTQTGLGITATAANGSVKLTGAIQQATFEIAGTNLSLLDGPDEIARDALLAFMGVMRDASHDAIEKASSILNDDSLFDPSLTIVGEISPAILGIPLGKPPFEGELILNKRGLAFGMDFSVVKTLNTLGAAASGPLAGTVTSLLNLLPAPFSDRLFADVRFPFADDSGQMVDSLIALLDGQLPLDIEGNPLIIDPLSDNWAAVFQGTFNVFDIPLYNLGGMMFPPDSPHLLDARIQKVYDDPRDPKDPENPGDENAIPDTPENLNCMEGDTSCKLFTLDTSKFQVTEKEFFDGMVAYGGILVSGGYTVPAFLRDPMQVIGLLGEPSAEFPETQDQVPAFLQSVLDDLAQAQEEFSKVEELAKLQFFFPSFASVLEMNFVDYTVETPASDLDVTSDDFVQFAEATVPFSAVDADMGTFLAIGHEFQNGDPVLLTTDDPPDGLSSGKIYYVAESTPNQFRLARARAAAERGETIEILSAGLGDHSFTRSSHIRAIDNEFVVGDVVRLAGGNLPAPLMEKNYFVTEVLADSFALSESSQDAHREIQIEFTSTEADTITISPVSTSGKPRVDYKSELTEKQLESRLNDVIGAAFFEGLFNEKLLGIELAQGRIRGDASGVAISGAIPWLGGLHAEFQLETEPTATLTAPLKDKEGNVLVDEVKSPWASVAAEVSIDTRTVPNSLSEWQQVMQALGIPLQHVQISDSASATFRAFSPYFDPLSVDPLERKGGIGLEASLDIAGLLEDGQFTFVLSPPATPGDPVGFLATAPASAAQMNIFGLSGTAPELLDLGDFDVTLSHPDGAVVPELGLHGTIKILDSLRLKVDGLLDITDAGILGEIPLDVVNQFGEVIGEVGGVLGLSDDSKFFLRFDPAGGARIHVVGDLDLPGTGFQIAGGSFDLTSAAPFLRMDVAGGVDFLGQGLEIEEGSFLDIGQSGVSGSFSLSLESGDPFFELTSRSLLGRGPSWMIRDTDDPGNSELAALALGLSVTPAETELTIAGNVDIPTLSHHVAVSGSLNSNGYGGLTGLAQRVPILSPQGAFELSGAIDLQRFEDKNLPSLSLNVSGAELTWGSVNLGLGQTPFAIEPNGHLLAEFPAQTLDLLAGAGDQGMQLLVTRPGKLEVDVDDFALSIPLSKLSVPGFPTAIPLPNITIDNPATQALPLQSGDGEFDLGFFRIKGPMVIELGDQPVLRFIEEGRPTSVNGELTVIRFPRVQIPGPGPGLFDEEVRGELVVDVQGKFDVDILDGAIGADGLGITDARLSIQKTGPGIETLAMDVRGGRLRMPLVKPIDLPSLRIEADGIIGQFNARHELVETIALTAIRLGEQFVLASVPVKLAIAASEEVTGFLKMTLADDASSVAMSVLGGIMNLTNWTVLSFGGFLGTVETMVGNPFALPESEVFIADGSFSLRRTGDHFELHVSNALTIDVGFVSASFESDSYIASDGDYSFSSFVADDVHLGDDNVLAISGDSSVTLRKENTSHTFEVTLNNAQLRLPFNTGFDLPDLTFEIDGTLPAFPFAFPSGVTLGETFVLPSELPFSLNVDSAGVVRLARTPAFDVQVILGSLPSFLPFHDMTLDSTGSISADAAGDLQIHYPIVVDGEIETMTFSLPTGISFDVTLDDGLFKVELPSPQQIDLGFFDGLFTGDILSNGTFSLTTGEQEVDFGSNSTIRIVGDGQATLDQGGFSGGLADAALTVLGFPLVDTSHTFGLTRPAGTYYEIRIPNSHKKTIDLGFLEVKIKGWARSNGSFSFSGSQSISFDGGSNVNKVSGTVSVKLKSSTEFEGSFSGSVTVGGVKWRGVTGTVSENGCLRIRKPISQKFAFPGGECSGRYLSLHASDGFISGGTAFFDANANGVIDFLDANGNGIQDNGEPGEPASTTDAEGGAGLFIPPEFDLNGDGAFGLDEGRIVVIGGIDLTTMQPLRVPLSAPAEVEGNVAITPLTTIATTLASVHGLDIETAVLAVIDAFEIPAVDLLHLDPIGEFQSGNASAATVFAAGAKVQGTLTQVSLLVQSATGLTQAQAADAALGALADQIVASAGTIDLADPATVALLIEAAFEKVAAGIDATLADAAAIVVSAANQKIDAVSPSNQGKFLFTVARAQSVAQGTTADQLAAAAQGNLSVDDLLAGNTGGGLADRINDAVIGDIVPPQIEIQGDQRSAGAGEVAFDFNVRLTKPSLLPVIVEFETLDGTLVAENGDYTSVAGELTFAPGELHKSIRVVAQQLEPDDELFVDLFAPVNAVLADVRVRGSSFVDSDGDGASDDDEAASPNQGDGNGDGVPDVDQANVASLRDALTQSYVTIVSATGTQLVVRAIDNRLPNEAGPNRLHLPLGLIEFTVTGLEPAELARVDILLTSEVNAYAYYQFGPTPSDSKAGFVKFERNDEGTPGSLRVDRNGDGITDISLILVDGGPGDHDLVKDGRIVSAGGFATAPWQNPRNAMDVNRDGSTSPLDALIIINYLNSQGATELPDLPTAQLSSSQFRDTNGDNRVSPIDVLLVFNFLNDAQAVGGEGGPSKTRDEFFEFEPAKLPAKLLSLPAVAPSSKHEVVFSQLFADESQQPFDNVRVDIGDSSAIDRSRVNSPATETDALLTQWDDDFLDDLIADLVDDFWTGRVN